MLEFALRYIRLGWPVLPLRGKVPRVEHGSKDATLDEAQARKWWEKWPKANIGLATGHKFFAVDIDAKTGGLQTWDTLLAQHGRIPDTIEQITGTGGRHLLFALPSDFLVHNSQGKLGPGLDIRGGGGYIVAAPSVHPQTNSSYVWDGINELEDQVLAHAPSWLLTMLRQDPARESPALIAGRIPEGQRNSALFREASRLRRHGWAVEEILASLSVVNERRCSPPLAEQELRQIAESAARYRPTQNIGGSAAAAPPGATAGEPQSTGLHDLLLYPYTDSGNGERLAALYQDEIAFCVEMGKWLVWDGRRWAVDDSDQVGQKAKAMARLLVAQAAGIVDKDERKIAEKWARKSESHVGIMAALKRAVGEPRLPVHVTDLDRHPYLLNCLNGTVNLRSGEVLPHDQRLLITKLCHIEYDPRAQCPRFLQFLEWAMGGGNNPDAEPPESATRLTAFLQRAFGYSLTADVSDKVAFVFIGPKGNNGKTTLLTVFRKLLAEYSTQISIDTLMMTHTQDAALRADLADLRGARLVTTSEVEKEHRLSEGKLKYITAGMGNIKACRKYENPIEFPATHKLFMDCNHRPVVRGTDNAVWRRLKPIPFEVEIAEDDPAFDKNLADKLIAAEGQGILAWAVGGCQIWARDGLGDPPEITQANISWREHDDPLAEFFHDCCQTGGEAWVRCSELSDTYAWWCKKNHERFPLSRENFGDRIQARGFRQSRSRRSAEDKQMRTWEGLSVREDVVKLVRAEAPRTLLDPTQ